jgi:hypothetical protein
MEDDKRLDSFTFYEDFPNHIHINVVEAKTATEKTMLRHPDSS